MIIKKIRRRTAASTGGSEFAYMNHLSRYIVRADVDALEQLVHLSDDDYLRDLARYAVAEGRESKAEAVGAINMLGDTLEKWEAEMTALLHRCPDSAGVIDHWIFSWPEGEKPTITEMKRTFAIFMQCQGLARAKGLWGSHRDTGNPHGHVLTLRVDPVTGERMTAGDGWDIDAAHRAKAVIEAEFPHWMPEAGSRYVVRDGMLIERASDRVIGDADDPTTWSRRRTKSITTAERPKSHHPAIDAEALAYEDATGFMSRKRVAVEIAVPIVLSAASLDAAHAELAKRGIELRRERSGAAFVIDGKTVKASIDRRTSHDALVARFGQPLEPSFMPVVDRPPRERWPADPERRAYYAARRPYDERLAVVVADVRQALGSSAKRGVAAAALAAAASAAAFPAFEAWRQGAVPADPAELVYGAVQLSEIAPVSDVTSSPPPSPAFLAGYRATQLADRVVYRSIGQRGGRPAFVDLGHKVLVHAGDDRDAVRASLLLVANRYPTDRIAVTGDRAFQRLVLEIANEERIQLDGALGRRQARQMPGLSTAPSRAPGPPTDVAPASQETLPATRPSAVRYRQRVLATLGRVFHRSDWNASDYWETVDLRQLPARIPQRSRRLEASAARRPAPHQVPRPRPADLARRAAILAAARGR